MIRRPVAIAGSIAASLMGLGYLWWVCGGASFVGRTPVFQEDMPGMDGNVRVSVINVSGRPISVAVHVDEKLKLAATLPSNRWMWQDYRAAGGFPMEIGEHRIEVRVAAAGLVAQKQFTQASGVTNHFSVAIFKTHNGKQLPGCSINLKTNILGVL